MGNGVLGLLAATALTVGLLIVTLKLLQRAGAVRGGQRRLPLKVLDKLALSPKQGVALLRVGRRVLVVGLSDAGPRYLAELRGEDRVAALGDPEVAAVPPSKGDPELKRLLSRLTLVIGLTVASASVAAAQPARDSVRVVPISPPRSLEPAPAAAAARTQAPNVTAPKPPAIDVKIGQGNEQLRLSGTVGLVVFMGALTLLPAVVLLMTSFTRIVIVLHFVRSAIGTQGSPPGQILVAIAVLLSGVVMAPVIEEANRVALQPYFAGQIEQADAYRLGVAPFRRFMLANVREKDLATFANLSGVTDAASEDDIPTLTLMTAFVTSELQTAFWMGFVVFLPFVVVDLIVATALMSLGMFMVPPVMISLPFKLLLFVLADGWSLLGQNLVMSFQR